MRRVLSASHPFTLAAAVLVTVGTIACDRDPTGSAENAGTDTKASGESDPIESAAPEPPSVPTPEAVAPTHNQQRHGGDEESPPPGALPNPRPIELGASIEEQIADPKRLQSETLHFETDWYALPARSGQRVAITVEPTPGSRLRPMVTVLLPDANQPGEWREVDALRSREEGEPLELGVTFQTSGTKLITVDDARNVPHVGSDDRPSTFHGGSAYGYEMRVESGRAASSD